VKQRGESVRKDQWLPGMDSNFDSRLQGPKTPRPICWRMLT
jgi:hypothetical protein